MWLRKRNKEETKKEKKRSPYLHKSTPFFSDFAKLGSENLSPVILSTHARISPSNSAPTCEIFSFKSLSNGHTGSVPLLGFTPTPTGTRGLTTVAPRGEACGDVLDAAELQIHNRDKGWRREGRGKGRKARGKKGKREKEVEKGVEKGGPW